MSKKSVLSPLVLALALALWTGVVPAKAAQSLRIMPLGDSITFGSPNRSYGGYRHALGPLLAKDAYTVAFVGSRHSGDGIIPDPDNEGHPGWTISQIKNGIDDNRWLEVFRPDIILLHIGTNDIRHGVAAAAPEALSSLLDDMRARLPRARIIVAQIIPFRRGPDAEHRAYNAAITNIVAAKGPLVSTIDMSSILGRKDYADGLHPNDGGYDKMAHAWESAIRAAMMSDKGHGVRP